MPGLIGIGLAVLVGLFAHLVGFDRDRAFYPVVLTVIASYYLLFAVMGGGDLLAESAIFAAFATVAVIGFRTSMWIVVAGLAAHGAFDFVRHLVLEGRAVPLWWPGFCLAYDVTAAVGLSLLLVLRRKPAPVSFGRS
ncbi:hypothetical protein [Sphingomonas segetis]|jgi:hypothetical protein|uniref:hypothetical protein n=1 Tax=Sphingomonas segetis TaxID=1104779 RepID=UPI0012D36009|nr:hypothetical protein [Sphingomonas segetis]